MVVSALWAGIAGLLKVTRGVSEVISTIMLNFIATGMIAYFLREVAVPVAGSNNIGTKPLPESGRLGGLEPDPGQPAEDLRLHLRGRARRVWATRCCSTARGSASTCARPAARRRAAVASGVNVKRMVADRDAALRRGGRAGRDAGAARRAYSYSLTFPAGLGFTGIAIALLGRNQPVGMAFGALLWAYLDVSREPAADPRRASRSEIVTIMQGVIVLSVVVAYELVRRYSIAQEQRRVAARAGRGGPPPRERQEVTA